MKLPHWRTIRDMHNAARDRRLALRKAARQEANPWKRGHITRKINAGAV